VSDWRFELYGDVGHSFTNPRADDFGMPGIAFDAKADARSWAAVLGLFEETIAPGGAA
jgi:dienelactone hydrolase